MMEPGMILLSWTIEGDKNKYGPQPVEMDAVNSMKNTVIRKAVCARIHSLLIQRKNAYQHSGHYREETLKAVQHLEYNLSHLRSITSMLPFFEYAITEVIPHLTTIQPPKESRYVNYLASYNSLETFCKRCLDSFEGKQLNNRKAQAETA